MIGRYRNDVLVALRPTSPKTLPAAIELCCGPGAVARYAVATKEREIKHARKHVRFQPGGDLVAGEVDGAPTGMVTHVRVRAASDQPFEKIRPAGVGCDNMKQRRATFCIALIDVDSGFKQALHSAAIIARGRRKPLVLFRKHSLRRWCFRA